jgi:hypothetical protein
MAGVVMVFLYAVLVFIFDRDVRDLTMSLLSALEHAGREWIGNTG